MFWVLRRALLTRRDGEKGEERAEEEEEEEMEVEVEFEENVEGL